MLLEDGILHQRHITRQHHQRFGLDVLILLRPVPLPPRPLLIQQEAEVIVRHHGRAERPRAIEAGAVGVAPPEGVGAREGHNLPIVKPHAPEDGAQMALLLRPVRETAVGRAEGGRPVLPPGPPWDLRALHLLDGRHAGQGPQVGVRDPWELPLDGFEEVAGGFEAGVGAVVGLGVEPHGCAVGAAGVGGFVVGAAAVPGEAEDDGAVGAIVVVVLFHQAGGDGVVDFLVVGLGWGERAAGLAGATFFWASEAAAAVVEVDVASASSYGEKAESEVEGCVGGFGGWPRGVVLSGGLLQGL